MAVQIQFRRDTGANWSSANTVLAAGEMGINTTTNQFKIGDGTTAWNSLSYAPISGTVAQLDAIEDVTITSASSGQFLKWNGTAWVNDAIDLGTDTTGNYMSNVSAGTGISVTHTQSEGSTATIAVDATVALLASPTFTGTPASTTAAVDTNTTQIATTAYVVGQGYAKLASPALTGTPTAPTAAVSTNSTQIATTAYVIAASQDDQFVLSGQIFS